MSSRFTHITILHGRDETPANSPARLAAILHSVYPNTTISTPYLPPTMTAKEAFEFAAQHYVNRMTPNSLIIGFGEGGLLACALQAKFPALHFSVFAVNAPTGVVGLEAQPCANTYSRVALYSSAYAPIKDRCNWLEFTPLAFDVVWMAKPPLAFYPITYLVSAFAQGKELPKEVEMMFPPEFPTEK